MRLSEISSPFWVYDLFKFIKQIIRYNLLLEFDFFHTWSRFDLFCRSKILSILSTGLKGILTRKTATLHRHRHRRLNYQLYFHSWFFFQGLWIKFYTAGAVIIPAIEVGGRPRGFRGSLIAALLWLWKCLARLAAWSLRMASSACWSCLLMASCSLQTLWCSWRLSSKPVTESDLDKEALFVSWWWAAGSLLRGRPPPFKNWLRGISQVTKKRSRIYCPPILCL